MIWLILGLILFLGIHSLRIVAAEVREKAIEDFGETRWKLLYSVVSLIGFVLIVWGYGQARQTAPVLYVGPYWLTHVVALLMIPVFPLLVASQLPAGQIKAAVKHPTLVAVKIWAVAHLLVNGDLASLLLFLSFLAWAVVDRISEKRRLQAGITTNPKFTSGRSDLIAVVLGFILYALFIWKLHVWLIGVAPIP